MKLIIKPLKLNLDDYITLGCENFLFSLKGFSSFATKEISLKTLNNLITKYPKIHFYISIDCNLFDEDIPKLKKLLRQLEKLTISGIFFHDLGILNIVKEEKLNIKLILSQNYLVCNSFTCNYYKTFSVKGIHLPSEITIKEINEIKEDTSQDLYINLFGYQLMAFSKRKLLSDYYQHNKKLLLKKEHTLLFEDKKYFIKENPKGTMFISDFILNSLDHLKELKNINYGILNEFNLDHNNFLEAVKAYKLTLSNKKSKIDLNNFFDDLDLGFLNKKTVYKVK